MVEQFSSFVQEALEFLSLLRASEKERFEAQKKFMTETTKILKELAESNKKVHALIKTSMDDLKQLVDFQIKKIEEKIGVETLTQAIKSLETSVDLLQRGSTILDYKFTVQKTRDLLDELKGNTMQVKNAPTLNKPVSPPQTAAKLTPTPSPAEKVPTPPPSPASIKKQSAPPPQKPDTSEDETDNTPSYQKFGSSVASMMGTRTRPVRPAVQLKKTPRKKIVTSDDGEPIEIETGYEEDDE